MTGKKRGDQVTLHVITRGKGRDVRLTLGERPADLPLDAGGAARPALARADYDGGVPAPAPAPRLKVCGVTSREDALHAVEAGAWAVGLSCGRARSAPARCRRPSASAARCAGAPRSPASSSTRRSTRSRPSRRASGSRSSSSTGTRAPPSAPRSRAAPGRAYQGAPHPRARRRGRAEPFHTDFHLADAYVAPDRYGGTGQTFEWSLLRGRHSSVPLILSGGLTPENVGDAIAAVRPHAVDVASGTEARPGVKDPARVEAFAAAVRAAGERLAAGVA